MARGTRKIEVVKEGDELFFKEETHQVPFRRIHCLYEFTVSRTVLRVERDGKVLSETSDVDYVGRSSESRFFGLEGLFSEGTEIRNFAESFGLSKLESKNFQTRDVITLETDDMPDEFSLARYDEWLTGMTGEVRKILQAHTKGIELSDLQKELEKPRK